MKGSTSELLVVDNSRECNISLLLLSYNSIVGLFRPPRVNYQHYFQHKTMHHNNIPLLKTSMVIEYIKSRFILEDLDPCKSIELHKVRHLTPSLSRG
jgi:hypothetical protein